MEFSRQEYWSGLPFSTSRDLCNPEIESSSFASPALASRFFTTSATWEARTMCSVHSLSHVCLFATPWTEAHQASLSITNAWSLLKLISIESVMPSNHLIFCRPVLLLPSIFPSIRDIINLFILTIWKLKSIFPLSLTCTGYYQPIQFWSMGVKNISLSF